MIAIIGVAIKKRDITFGIDTQCAGREIDPAMFVEGQERIERVAHGDNGSHGEMFAQHVMQGRAGSLVGIVPAELRMRMIA